MFNRAAVLVDTRAWYVVLVILITLSTLLLAGKVKAEEDFQRQLIVGIDVGRTLSILFEDAEVSAGTPGTTIDSVWAVTLKSGLSFGMKLGVKIPDGSSHVGIRFSPGLVIRLTDDGKVSMAVPALLYTVTPGYGGKKVKHMYGVGIKLGLKITDFISIGPSVIAGHVHGGPSVVGFKFGATFWIDRLSLR